MSTTITSKGQVTIPKHIRERLGLKAGSRLIFEVNRDGELVLRPKDESELAARRERILQAISAVKIDNPWTGTTDEYMALIRGEE
jgi:antitoxin PrlF